MQTFCQTITRLQIKRTFLLLKSNLVWAVIEIISTYHCSFRYKELTLDPCPNGKPLAIKYGSNMIKQCLVSKHVDVVLSDHRPNKQNVSQWLIKCLSSFKFIKQGQTRSNMVFKRESALVTKQRLITKQLRLDMASWSFLWEWNSFYIFLEYYYTLHRWLQITNKLRL